MEFSRRSFMQLLGIGGVASAALTPIFSPLFGSDDAPRDEVLSPDHRMVSGHFVVHPKGLVERVSKEEQAEYAARTRGYNYASGGVPVARITRNREPTKQHLRRTGSIAIPPVTYEGMPVADGHAAFYVASMDVRDAFTKFTRQTLEMVEPELRAMASLVTIADSPIHARPKMKGSSTYDGNLPVNRKGNYQLEDDGFEVAAEFTQFVVLGMPRREIETYRIFSESGEFPMIVPRDIDMGMLLKMDKEIVSGRVVARDRITALLARFT